MKSNKLRTLRGIYFYLFFISMLAVCDAGNRRDFVIFATHGHYQGGAPGVG